PWPEPAATLEGATNDSNVVPTLNINPLIIRKTAPPTVEVGLVKVNSGTYQGPSPGKVVIFVECKDGYVEHT
ncbi:MAG: hypothetical protein WCF44_07675, partial [Candidatus Methylophosphatis roskildensis]